MPITICLAGATGWAGSEMGCGIATASDAVARAAARGVLAVENLALTVVRLPGYAISAEVIVGLRCA